MGIIMKTIENHFVSIISESYWASIVMDALLFPLFNDYISDLRNHISTNDVAIVSFSFSSFVFAFVFGLRQLNSFENIFDLLFVVARKVMLIWDSQERSSKLSFIFDRRLKKWKIDSTHWLNVIIIMYAKGVINIWFIRYRAYFNITVNFYTTDHVASIRRVA